MIWKKKIKFDIRAFHDFAHDIEHEWGLESIRFRTSHNNLFDSAGIELSHLAKSDPFQIETFTGKLNQHLDTVKWFSFNFYKNNGSRNIKMEFDLINGVAILEGELDTDSRKIKKFLLDRMAQPKRKQWKQLFKFTVGNIWTIAIGVLGSLIAAWLLIRFGGK